MIDVNLDLVRKYDVPAPRYTSYPTAVQFCPVADPGPMLAHIDDANRDASLPLSLYVHLPFCEALCWFCGCNKVITTDRSAADRYLDSLAKEVALLAPRIHSGRRVVQLHLGGGTPTFLTPAQMARLMTILRGSFTFASNAELSVEIDPRRLDPERMEAMRVAGFNRASLGVQDFHPAVQLAIHRVQPRAMTEQAIRWLREAGFASVNVDLIYGLPHQTEETFADTLAQVCELAPDRLAVFSYAHVPWVSPAQKLLERSGALPTPTTKLGMFKLVTETLTCRGYSYIGLDHFARETDELAHAMAAGALHRNFQGYTTCPDAELVALGVSAISQTPRTYRQNHRVLGDYIASLDRGELPIAKGVELDDEDVRRRKLIMEIMCRLKLDFAALSSEFGVDVAQRYAAEIERLKPLAADGLVEVDPAGVRVTGTGRLFLRNIACCFDAYYAPEAKQHARSV